MAAHRSLLKRAALWTAAVVLGIVGYVAGMPIVGYVAFAYAPASMPFLEIVYAPVIFALDRELPGTRAYLTYYFWCLETIGADVEYP